VILTDFRAFDTLGEITVLAVVAMGAMALVAARRPDDAAEADTSPVHADASDRGETRS
jgi:hypothetical protein